ncbi:hypothetical protein FSOLCH5_010142 [Fusarium solani]|uniref:Aspartic peptidase domain-containing protein n=1 Tax=Fusarium solani TaxID=169388 RepID=A0A9P9KN46_FUSSL|nr:aspartic peptidase domain-containing protein [Fusarium solani]KAH7264341.1 aspartic peptidase domain-containing protein [Fusarium solani]
MAFRNFLLATSLASGLSSAAVLDLPIVHHNSYDLVEFNVGTPATTYRLLFDTGSATSWIVDQNCAEECTNFSGYKRTGYNVDNSTTGKLTGRWGEIEYFGGTTAGLIANDVFKAGKVSWNQSFIAASQSSWGNIPGEGFFGLAFNSITVGAADTIMYTLVPKLDAPKFGLYYGPASETADGVGKGRLTLGASKASTYTDGKLVKVPIVPTDGKYDVWASVINSATGSRTVNGKKIKKTTDLNAGRVVFDTGAGRTSLPKGQIQAVYESIGMNWTAIIEDGYRPLCKDFNSTWSVSFAFGDANARNPPVVTLTGDQLATPGFAMEEKYCWPPFDEGDYEGLTLVGKDILTKLYTVWDFGAKEEAKYKPTLSFGTLKKGFK